MRKIIVSIVAGAAFLSAGCTMTPTSGYILSKPPVAATTINKPRKEVAACLYTNSMDMKFWTSKILRPGHYAAQIIEMDETTRVEWRMYDSKKMVAVYKLTGSNPTFVELFWYYSADKKRKFKRLPFLWLDDCEY